MKCWIPIAITGLILGAAATRAAQVGLIKIDGAIGPATASYISRAIDVSAAQNDECLVIELNTPGGLANSMNDIVQVFYAERVPTVVYVAPEGAMAGSAGVYITLAANIAAMAPHTTIGAAHPVEMGNEDETTNSIMMQKVGNAYTKVMQTIAEKRHRNVEWAKSSVTESKAITSEEALKLKVIDLIATNVPDLLQKLNGRSVNGKMLKTTGADIVEIPMTPSERLFQLFWLPEVMMLLMLIGVFLLWRRSIERQRWWLCLAVLAMPAPILAVEVGWMTAEVGRQPWIVQGLMMVSAGTSPSVTATDVSISLVAIVLLYALLFLLWIYGLTREIRRGPETGAAVVPAASGTSPTAVSSLSGQADEDGDR